MIVQNARLDFVDTQQNFYMKLADVQGLLQHYHDGLLIYKKDIYKEGIKPW